MKATRRCRWEWHPTPGTDVRVDLSALNLPRVALLGHREEDRAILSMTWGARYSDPVFMVDVLIRVPRMIGRRLKW